MAKVKSMTRSKTNAKSKPKSKAKTRSKVAPKATAAATSASRLIDERIRELGGWRGETLSRMRALIQEADPAVTEEWKWSNPVWSHDGLICTGEAYAKAVKLTFAQGAKLPDLSLLFNSSLAGNTRRAIDLHEGETVDAGAFKALVKAAIEWNRATARKDAPRAKAAKSAKPMNVVKPAKQVAPAKPVKLLSGGNPQIAKGDGDAPVQAYLAALPGWKGELGHRLDALITRVVPNVRKAVKWNSPFYGVEGQGWFLSFHAFTRYVKVTFFRGAALQPVPPGGTEKSKETRWLDLHEGEPLDEVRFASWLEQAAGMPGWEPGQPS